MTAAAPAADAPSPPAVVRRVTITDAGVVPGDLVVFPSEAVVWRNGGRNRHTVTADAGLFGSGTLIPGDTFRITAPARPGDYAYHCIFHAYIRGTLSVSSLRLAAPAEADYGRRVTIRASAPRASAGAPARVERRASGAWVPIGEGALDASRAFTVRSAPLSSTGVFRAVIADQVSPSVRVGVQPVIAVGRHGSRLTVLVRPGLPGATARLERQDAADGAWRRTARRRLSSGRATFALDGPGVYRVVVGPRGGLDERASRPVRYRA